MAQTFKTNQGEVRRHEAFVSQFLFLRKRQQSVGLQSSMLRYNLQAGISL